MLVFRKILRTFQMNDPLGKYFQYGQGKNSEAKLMILMILFFSEGAVF